MEGMGSRLEFSFTNVWVGNTLSGYRAQVLCMISIFVINSRDERDRSLAGGNNS
jgi:hypothetical protein